MLMNNNKILCNQAGKVFKTKGKYKQLCRVKEPKLLKRIQILTYLEINSSDIIIIKME